MSISKNNSALQLSYEEFFPQVVPIIFLHGLMSGKETWKECASYIARKTGSMVYYYDTRNCGGSPWTESMSAEDLVGDLGSFMDMKNVEKAVIVGHSLGGITALSFAAKYPERVSCLILEDSTVNMFNSFDGNNYLQVLLARREIISRLPPDVDFPEADRIIRSYFENKRDLAQSSGSDEMWKLWDASARDGGWLQCEDGQLNWKKINIDLIINSVRDRSLAFKQLEGGYEGPVLVIYGTESQFTVLNDKENLLKRFPNAVYEAIEGGGHSLHTEYPDIYNKLVCDFIIKCR